VRGVTFTEISSTEAAISHNGRFLHGMWNIGNAGGSDCCGSFFDNPMFYFYAIESRKSLDISYFTNFS